MLCKWDVWCRDRDDTEKFKNASFETETTILVWPNVSSWMWVESRSRTLTPVSAFGASILAPSAIDVTSPLSIFCSSPADVKSGTAIAMRLCEHPVEKALKRCSQGEVSPTCLIVAEPSCIAWWGRAADSECDCIGRRMFSAKPELHLHVNEKIAGARYPHTHTPTTAREMPLAIPPNGRCTDFLLHCRIVRSLGAKVDNYATS